MSENLITIKLFGRSYNFKTDSDVDKAKEIADILINEVEKVQEKISAQNPEMTKFMVLMLAALNMAGEIYEIQQNQSQFMNKLDEKSSRLTRLLEESLDKNEWKYKMGLF